MRDIERANERGKSELGWLSSRFTYSFAEYMNPKRMGFGVLRVVNDDIVAPKSGFPLHHHEEMEIVTVMLSGVLTHEDSMGNKKELHTGEVQVMSAGVGVNHSEWNHDPKDAARLFQIWVYPKEKRLAPRYDQREFEESGRAGKFQLLVSGERTVDALFIHQDAKFFRASIDKGKRVTYELRDTLHGLFLMVISGKIKIGDDLLDARDTMEVQDESYLELSAVEAADVLLIELPMR